MPYIVSLEGFIPPPRFDEPPEPWVQAIIEESASSSGPWDEIDRVTMAPDENPDNPQTRNFTTQNGTLSGGYYRVTFVDVSGDQSQPSDPVWAGTSAPSTLPTLTYAQISDLETYAPETLSLTDAEKASALLKAERDIDWYAGFGGAPNDVSGLRFDPVTDINDVPTVAGLMRATCAQAQYRLYMGEAFFTDQVQYREVGGDARTETNRPSLIGPQARREFPRALGKHTGTMRDAART
jgi:hypothetical protein